MKIEFDAVVIGLGPAGMRAAVALVESGVKTAVIDDQPASGGQIYRQLPKAFRLIPDVYGPKMPPPGGQLLHQLKRIAPQLTVFANASVYGYFNDHEIAIVQNDRLLEIGFGKLIICEGGMERTIPFPGWTLPGIMTAGGLQRLLKQQRLLAGRRILLAGTGPLLVSVAAGLVAAGADRVWLCEAAPFQAALRFIPAIVRHRAVWPELRACIPSFVQGRITIRQPFGVIAAEGSHRVAKATIARLDSQGTPIAGTEKHLAVDIVGLNHGFIPQNRLTRLVGCRHHFLKRRQAWHPQTNRYQQTSQADIYAAGDGAGIGGAQLAATQGDIAGLHAAAGITKRHDAAQLQTLLNAASNLGRYADALFKCYGLRTGLFDAIDNDTVICRCEGVTAGRIWDAMRTGSRSFATIKPTRVAMGSCQGRVCEATVSTLMARAGITPGEHQQLSIRPPLKPLSIEVLANNIEPADASCAPG